jgi:hypothetical protein
MGAMNNHEDNEQSLAGFLASGAASATSGLGIDIGRVIMCPVHDDGQPDTSFLTANDAAALETPASPGMFEVVPRLVEAFGGRVWLVSKAGARVEALTRRWFLRHEFFARTGMPEAHARFCRRREDKRAHAAELGLTHFIDDRVDVLGHLRGLVPHLALFGVQTEPAPAWTIPIADWRAVGRALSQGSG